MQILDGGRGYNGGKPPADVRFNDAHVPNPHRSGPPQTILGAEQKAWFKDKLRSATATWEVWGNSLGALDSRADPQNLPAGLTKEAWPPDGRDQLPQDQCDGSPSPRLTRAAWTLS